MTVADLLDLQGRAQLSGAEEGGKLWVDVLQAREEPQVCIWEQPPHLRVAACCSLRGNHPLPGCCGNALGGAQPGCYAERQRGEEALAIWETDIIRNFQV